ncbi:MAG: hypothetical protein WD232_08515 [Acidimicrobiales bacterium]
MRARLMAILATVTSVLMIGVLPATAHPGQGDEKRQVACENTEGKGNANPWFCEAEDADEATAADADDATEEDATEEDATEEEAA